MHSHSMSLHGLAALLIGASEPAAQTFGKGAASAPAAADWFEIIIFTALAVTAAAVTAALIAVRRLRRANALHRDVFGAVPQPRQVVDSHGGTIFANKAFYKYFGGIEKPTPELLAAEEAGDKEVRDQIERLAANARKGIPGYEELPARARNNPEIGAGGGLGGRQAEWRYVAAYPISGRPGTVLWTVADITLRRQLEQVIHEEQGRFVDLLEHAPIGFYSVDGDGKFLFANRTLCDWLGLSYEDLESGTIRLHDVVADPLPERTQPFDPFGGGASHGEVVLKGLDGARFQTSISQDVISGEDGRGLRTRSVVRDLSRESAMAEALEHSVQRFERFFMEAPIGIALLDSAGRLSECNRAFSALVGTRAEDLAGVSFFDLVNEGDRDLVRAALAQQVNGGKFDVSADELGNTIRFTHLCLLYFLRYDRVYRALSTRG